MSGRRPNPGLPLRKPEPAQAGAGISPRLYLSKDGGPSDEYRHLYHADLPRLPCAQALAGTSAISYEERDLTDRVIMEEAKARTGVRDRKSTRLNSSH